MQHGKRYLIAALMDAARGARKVRPSTRNYRGGIRKMDIGRKLTVIAAMLISMLTTSVVFAQDDADTWEYSLAPYLWAVGLDGELVVKGVPVEMDLDFDELLDEVAYAVQVHFEAKKGAWSFIVDPTIIKVDSEQKMGPIKVDVELDYVVTEALVAYRIAPKWDLLGGVRYWSMDADIDIQGPPPSVDEDEDWIDIIVGARFFADISQKWSFMGRADIGGFDVGESADSTWNVAALFFRDFGRKGNKQFVAGYRILDVDFDKGSGASRFAFDMEQSGPVFGLNFQWGGNES